jgi:hypothetical protein
MTVKFNVNEEPSTSSDQGVREYFANKPREEIGHDLMREVDNYYNYIQQFGRMRVWRRAYDYYNRGWMKGSRLNRTGKQDEYMSVCINEFRNILLHLLVGVTANKLSPEPKAENTDYKSRAQTKIASGVVEHYNRILNMDRVAKKATEYGLVFGEGWVSVEWDANLGDEFGVGPQGQMLKQGDIAIDIFPPMDVIRDVTAEDIMDCNWLIIRRYKNKYDVAARYPDLADRIINLGTDAETLKNLRFSTSKYIETDQIPVYTFYHRKTPAVPNGKILEFLDSDLITVEGPLPYKNIPLYRITPDDQIKSVFGYTVAYDLMPLQEILDGLYSIIVTNQSTFGVQNIAMPTGANINVNALAEGLNLITFDPKFGGPSALNLVQTPPEIYQFIDRITQRMETISGLNSVVRGNPEASLKSGAALALVASQAVVFNSGLHQSFANMVESVWTAIIDDLKDYANTPRMIAIAGKSNRSMMKEFKGEDISSISRVTVEMGNPISRTIAGKLQLAQDMLQSGLVKTPEEYLTVATTGRLEPLYEANTSQMNLIKLENERMSEGQEATAMVTDDHRLHILEHGIVLSSPDAREVPQVVNAVVAHLQAHINYLNSTDPAILAVNGINQQPPPMGAVPQGMPGAGNMGAGGVMDTLNPTVAEAQQVNLPNQPKNPLSGETYKPGGPVPPVPGT